MGDPRIDEAVTAADATLLHLDGQRNNLIDAIPQQGPSAVLAERLQDVERRIETVRNDY